MNSTLGRQGDHELKYVFSNHLAAKMVSWLANRCQPDPVYPASRISSIYYDSRDWMFLREKLNSDYEKLKIRARWYADAHTLVPLPRNFIEAKFKIGSARNKVRLPTGLDTEWLIRSPLDQGLFLELPKLLRPLGVPVRETLYPALQISYTRTRFIDPLTGARICVDQDIHVPRANPAMLNRMRPTVLPQAVVEYKEEGDALPDWLTQITAFQGRRAAFSKYGTCYGQVTTFTF